MNAGKITAKLRDAVPVCFMVEGKEVKQYRNIDLPDELKELEIRDFQFNVPADGKITFHLHFDKGVLPEVFPAARAKVTRAEKAAAKEVAANTAPTPAAAPATAPIAAPAPVIDIKSGKPATAPATPAKEKKTPKAPAKPATDDKTPKAPAKPATDDKNAEKK